MRDLLEELIERKSGCTPKQKSQALRPYKLKEIFSIGWISFDDIEFNLSEALTADELAQCLIEVTKIHSQLRTTYGETEHYRLYYDEQQPGEIVLEEKQLGTHQSPPNPPTKT